LLLPHHNQHQVAPCDGLRCRTRFITQRCTATWRARTKGPWTLCQQHSEPASGLVTVCTVRCGSRRGRLASSLCPRRRLLRYHMGLQSDDGLDGSSSPASRAHHKETRQPSGQRDRGFKERLWPWEATRALQLVGELLGRMRIWLSGHCTNGKRQATGWAPLRSLPAACDGLQRCLCLAMDGRATKSDRTASSHSLCAWLLCMGSLNLRVSLSCHPQNRRLVGVGQVSRCHSIRHL
jgi:hypothetical protein